MLKEIQEGVKHLCDLVNEIKSFDEDKRDRFYDTVCDKLARRYKGLWFEHDGERGSAKRSLVWHPHGGGEGMDNDLKVSIKETFSISSFDSLKTFFISSFTLWIDPGCVAIRLGYGPGSFVEGSHLPSPTTTKIIFGTMPGIRPLQHTSKTFTPVPPVLTLLPSTPALDLEDPNPNSTLSHFRTPSWASSFRSVSNNSSSGSRSASGGSEGEGSEACPSLIAASSTRGDSDSEIFDDGDDDDDEEDTNSDSSIQDLLDRGGFKNFHIIDDDEEDEEEGEEHCGDETVQAVNLDSKTTTSNASVKKITNVTSYDGGNVGVLGGGVRLGGGNKSSQQNKQNNLQHKISSNTLRAKQISAPAWHPNQNNWSSIERSPVAQSANLSNPTKGNASWSMYSPNFSSNAGVRYSPAIGANGCPSPQYVVIDGVAVPIATPTMKRARGRRSRGRGAGRAARRQAAAAKAQQEGSIMWSPLDDNCSPSSALGITLNPTMNSSSNNTPSGYNAVLTDFEADAQLMAMVRQRADQVAKDLVRRHLEKQQFQPQQQSPSIHSFTPRQNFTPAMTPSPLHHHQFQQPHHLPSHMIAHMQNQNQHFSPISQSTQWIH